MATYSLKGTDKQNLSHTLLNGHPFLASVKVLQQTEKAPTPQPRSALSSSGCGLGYFPQGLEREPWEAACARCCC